MIVVISTLLEPANDASQEPMPDTIPDLASWGIDLSRYTVFVPSDPFEDHVGPLFFDLQGDARKAGTCIACCRRCRATATTWAACMAAAS